jgi:hypothetical protein
MKRATLAVLLLGSIAHASPSQSGAFDAQWWIVSGNRAMVFDDGLKRIAEVDIGATARAPLLSPDQRHLAVASAGEMTSHKARKTGRWEFWPQPGSVSTVTVLKAGSLEVTGRRAVRFRPVRILYVDNETLLVVSAGQLSTEAEKQILPAITVLTVPEAEVRHEIELNGPPFDIWYHEASRLLHVACEGFGGRAAEIVTFDPERGTIRATVLQSDVTGIGWRTTGDPDTRYLELADGIVTVTSTGELVGPPIRAGTAKVFFAPMPDGGRYLLAGRSGDTLRLMILQEGRVTQQVEIDRIKWLRSGIRVSAAGSVLVVIGEKVPRLIVCSAKQGVVLHPETLAELGRLKLPGSFTDVLLDPAERRLYAYHGDSVTVVDVEHNRKVATFAIGSEFKKLVASGSRWIRVQAVRPQPSVDKTRRVFTMAFAPSGSHLFVYSATARDVTIVETDGHTSKRKVGIGDINLGGLYHLQGGRLLIAFKGNKIIGFDAEAGTVVAELNLPDSVYIWHEALDIIFIRSATGTIAHRSGTLERVGDLGPELALSQQAIADQAGGMMFSPRERLFVATTSHGVRLYDYDLKKVGDFDNVGRVDGVWRFRPVLEGHEEAEPF